MAQRIEASAVQSLIDALHKLAYTVIGPTCRNGAIVYDEIRSVADLPAGLTADQGPGMYRLRQPNGKELFGYAVGPHSWKKFLFPPEMRFFSARKHSKSFSLTTHGAEDGETRQQKFAFLGVRSCELHAMEIQNKVLNAGDYRDEHFHSVREKSFVIAVNCSNPSETCFCSSMGTGPEVDSECDLKMTEVTSGKGHYFVVDAGSHKGEKLLASLPCREATPQEVGDAAKVVAQAKSRIRRSLDTRGIKELLYLNVENIAWDKVGERCLSCANCTMVCPTCFCSTVEDTTDLTGSEALRTRKWDSCFTMDFSYIHGGSVRGSTKGRYRHWMTHKLATWIDQFGTSGCVGCGRCITWCPVGIDITEEAKIIRERTTGAFTTQTKEDHHGIS
jgi:sulfhydrogenase subunit beta (sulfur reductase)